jgi:hypothetical protein
VGLLFAPFQRQNFAVDKQAIAYWGLRAPLHTTKNIDRGCPNTALQLPFKVGLQSPNPEPLTQPQQQKRGGAVASSVFVTL